MAVTKMPQSTALAIRVQTGTSVSGNPVYSNRTYSNVKVAAADQDLYDVGSSLAGLQEKPVQAIVRQDTAYLVSE